MHANLLYSLGILSFSTQWEIRIDKPYRDGSGQSILVSPDKSMLTIKFTLKKEIEISICKNQVHTSVHLCVNIVNVHS